MSTSAGHTNNKMVCSSEVSLRAPALLGEYLDRHTGGARANHVDRLSRTLGKIDDAAADVWPAVVDPDNNRLAIVFIGYTNLGPELE